MRETPEECRRGSGGSQIRMRPSAALAGACLAALLWAGAARAELIVFEDGRTVKAASYRLLSEELEITLPGGGSYRVDLSRVERIVDDEVLVVNSVIVDDKTRVPEGPFDLSYQAARKPLFGTAFDELIEKEARRQNIDASFVSALIRAESNYEPRAISSMLVS